jgi:acyl-CoA thioester hydrolase
MMPDFKHQTPIEIRFADIDAFGHVNNAKYLTYLEQARVKYFDDIVDWTYDWSKEGIILARAVIDFIMPIHFRENIIIKTRCSRLGTKSFDLQYQMFKLNEDKSELLMADATTVMVAFDYVNKKTIEIPSEWREAVRKFEGDTFGV